jgi:glucuronate isomerase
MDIAVRRLEAELEKIPLVDPHSHINPHAPAAKSLEDLLGYHYYTELAHAAGMPKDELAAEGRKLVENIGRWLPALSNTVQYSWLVHLAQAFFGYQKETIGPADVGDLFDEVEKRTAPPNWPDEVFRKTNLEAIFLTNDFDDLLEGFDTSRYVPCLRTDDLVFKFDDVKVRARFARATKVEPTSMAAVCNGLGALFERFVSKGARACAISLPPDFEPQRPTERETDEAFARLLDGSSSPDDVRTVGYRIFFVLADRCEEFNLPFDLMIGVHRNVYRAGVFQGTDLFDQRTSLYQFRHLFNEMSRVKFPVSVLTHMQNQELVAYSWIFPNVLPCGHWWYSNTPAYIDADLRARLEAVPAGKQIGYYSDAYKLEFVLPKFSMYRRTLAGILLRDFVVARGWSEERALELGRAVLRDNVLDVFGKVGEAKS